MHISASYDPVIQALTGATDVQADRKTNRPQMFQVIIADKVTSLTAAQAISAGLFAKERTGKGATCAPVHAGFLGGVLLARTNGDA